MLTFTHTPPLLRHRPSRKSTCRKPFHRLHPGNISFIQREPVRGPSTTTGHVLPLPCLFSPCLDGRPPTPILIKHQGRRAVNGVNFQGYGQLNYALVNSTGTTTCRSNNGTSTAGVNYNFRWTRGRFLVAALLRQEPRENRPNA